MKAARNNGKDKAPDNGKDEKGNLDWRNVLLGRIVDFDVLVGTVPVGLVKLVGVNDDFSVLVVLSRLDVINKVAHLFLVGNLLGRLERRERKDKKNVSNSFVKRAFPCNSHGAFKNLRSRHQR